MKSNACHLAGVAALGLLTAAPVAGAQGYQLRLDTRVQSVAYRGVTLDSVAVSDTVVPPGGGPTSPDGYAVVCTPGLAYCTFFRPGPERSARPLTATADLSVWGLGLPGLRLHGLGRVGWDLAGSEYWPGTEPAFQLLEGYAEYSAARGTARLGRQVTASRLGAVGFDGARVVLRDYRRGLDGEVYGGWSLARGVALPVTSPALNPLDDFQPQRRFIVVGAGAGWRSTSVDVRADYRREVNPRTDHFVSERIGVQGAARALPGFTLRGGADYDMAAGWWGSAEAAAEYADARVRAAVGLRRYRPHFDLWTIWGAFSPVPYSAVNGALAVKAHDRVTVRGRYERYEFAPADAETPLYQVLSEGWRWEIGGTVTPASGWTLDGGFSREHGPGGATDGASGSVAYQPTRRLAVTMFGSTLRRPLEFRYNQAVVHLIGLEGSYEPATGVRVGFHAARYDEAHNRPDAGTFDWDQLRLAAWVGLRFGSGADVDGLPPAIRALPGGRADR